ncbi:MAG: (d)CMP kinase [Actinomycetota bacterium]|nr:(d)CMP kinase [Actinomycetota bacterium]
MAPARAGDLATLVVAVDGPSGSGKSSVSRGVAQARGLRYLDTGATYRALTWWMLQNDVDITDTDAVAALAAKPVLEAGTDPAAPTISVDGVDVRGPIRSAEVTGAVSAVSAVPAVRRMLRDLQRDVIGAGGIVVEGRDIGTVVTPDAPVKIYLTASPEARAQRRTAELAPSPAVTVAATEAELARRDRLDSTRPHSPLAKADDAHEIDATHLTLDQVIEAVLDVVDGAVVSTRGGFR